MNRKIALTVIGCIAFMALVVGLSARRFMTPDVMSREQLRQNNLYLHEAPREFEDFSLVDHNGDAFTRARLRDQWTLAFFGYTFCPDICPTTMSTLNNFSRELAEQTDFEDDTRVIMVSVDPRRDTPEKMKQYMSYFNEDFIGVTGEYIDIFSLTRELNIAFSYQESESGDAGQYLVNHSSQIVLFNPEGDYHGFFRAPHDPARMVETYSAARRAWQH